MLHGDEKGKIMISYRANKTSNGEEEKDDCQILTPERKPDRFDSLVIDFEKLFSSLSSI